MKQILFIISLTVLVISCKETKKENQSKTEKYASFGAKISDDKAMSQDELFTTFKGLKKGDTVAVKFNSKINAVCKKKGCWMRLPLDKDNETLVRFKDYGFFMPLNADGKEVVVSGKAYVDIVTVADQRHYAKDEGLSDEEINKITEDKVTYAVESDGVLMVN